MCWVCVQTFDGNGWIFGSALVRDGDSVVPVVVVAGGESGDIGAD